MREMKDSGVEWIGEIPVEWNCSKIKHHFKIGSGTTPKSDIPSYWDGDIVWITPADFKTDDVYVSEGHRNLTQEGFESSTLEIIPAGNIIFSKRAPIGQVVINSVDLCTNQGCLTAVPLDKSNVKYYRYAMSAATNQFELAGSGTTFKEISATAFGNFILPSPNVSEQNKITEYLDRKCSSIDSVIMKQQVIVDKLKEYKLSLITESVTRGLNYECQMKDSGIDYIGLVPAHWHQCRLRNIGGAQNGISKGAEYFGEGVPFVSYGDVYRNYSLPYEVQGRVRTTAEEQEHYSVEAGDIFFTRTSETIDEVGFSCVCEKTIPRATYAGFVIRVRPYSNVLYTGYAKYYFRSSHHRSYLAKEMNLVTRASLGQDLLKSMPVLVPPKEEQKVIASFLDEKCDEIDYIISQKESLISKLIDYKKSMVYEAVTGKREVL